MGSAQADEVNGHNCGQHKKKRAIPHWDGKKWCNGRIVVTKKKRAKEKMSEG